MKLYAGYDDGLYEYAIWATSKRSVAQLMGLRLYEVNESFHEQGAHLQQLCHDKRKVYRRDLGHDDNPWQAFPGEQMTTEKQTFFQDADNPNSCPSELAEREHDLGITPEDRERNREVKVRDRERRYEQDSF